MSAYRLELSDSDRRMPTAVHMRGSRAHASAVVCAPLLKTLRIARDSNPCVLIPSESPTFQTVSATINVGLKRSASFA